MRSVRPFFESNELIQPGQADFLILPYGCSNAAFGTVQLEAMAVGRLALAFIWHEMGWTTLWFALVAVS